MTVWCLFNTMWLVLNSYMITIINNYMIPFSFKNNLFIWKEFQNKQLQERESMGVPGSAPNEVVWTKQSIWVLRPIPHWPNRPKNETDPGRTYGNVPMCPVVVGLPQLGLSGKWSRFLVFLLEQPALSIHRFLWMGRFLVQSRPTPVLTPS